MTDLITEIQKAVDRKSDLRLHDAVATGDNTVTVGQSTVAVTLPAIIPVVAGDFCQVLEQGANRVILGPVGGPLLWSEASSGTTDASGDITITASTLSSITGAFGAQRNTTSDHRTTVHGLSGNTFKMRVRDGSGAVVASTAGVFYTAWAIGPPA